MPYVCCYLLFPPIMCLENASKTDEKNVKDENSKKAKRGQER